MFKNDVGRRRAFIVNFAYLLILGAIVFVIAKYLVPLLLPFVLAFVIAALLQKPIRFIDSKLPVKKRICGLCVAILFFAALFGLIYLGGGGVLSGVQRILVGLPLFYGNTIEPMVTDVFAMLQTIELGNLQLIDLLGDLEAQIMDALGGLATSISGWAVTFVSEFAASLPGLFIRLVLFIIATVFISMDYDVLMGWVIRQMGDKTRTIFFDVKEYIVGTLFVVIR